MNNIYLILLIIILLLLTTRVNEVYTSPGIGGGARYAGSLDDYYNTGNPDLTHRTAEVFKRCSPEEWPSCKGFDKSQVLRVPGRGPFPYTFKNKNMYKFNLSKNSCNIHI